MDVPRSCQAIALALALCCGARAAAAARPLPVVNANAAGAPALGYYYQDNGRVPDWYTLTVLPDLASSTRLAGTHVVVHNGGGTDATSNNRRFLFTPEDPHFSEVNAYVQTSLALGLFRDLGFAGFGVPCTVVVNVPCNAGPPASVSGLTVRLSAECVGTHRNAAHFADVIYRVATSLVLDRVGLAATGETAALREAVQDYFAASFMDSPNLRDWLLPACDARGRFGAMTWLDSDPAVFRYANLGAVSGCGVAAGEPVADGMILGGALWHLRQRLGYATCDSLVFRSLGYLPATADFATLRDALLRADQETRGGRFSAEIAAAFDPRGIRERRLASIAGPAVIAASASATYSAAFAGGAWPVQDVAWYQLDPCAGGRCPEDMRAIGDGPSITVAQEGDFRLRAVVTDQAGRETVAEKEVRVGYTPVGWILPLRPSDEPVVKPLPWLPPAGSPDWGTLNGRYVRVDDVRGDEATRTNEFGDFLYTPDSPHFDEVNVYYHATRYLAEYLPSFGFDSLQHTLPIHVNMTTPMPCAPCYVDGEVYLLHGPGGDYTLGNFARATDAIIHEVTHAILSRYAIQSSADRSAEHAALHEGLADFFAAAYTNDPRMGEEVYPQRYLDGTPRCPDGDTRVDNDFTYADLNVARGCYSAAPDPHGNGQIVSGALWECRAEMGDTLNILLIEALKILRRQSTSFPLLACFTAAVRAADRDLFGGRHDALLAGVFLRRGLTRLNPPRMTAPATRPPGEPVAYGFTTPCGVETVAEWSRREWDCELREGTGERVPVGTGASIAVSSLDDFQLRAQWVDDGGRASTDSLALTVGSMPFVVIDPDPGSVRRGTRIDYRAIVTRGYGPMEYLWEKSGYNVDGYTPWTLLSTDSVVSVESDQNGLLYYLRVRVTDAQCQWNRNQVTVRLTTAAVAEDGNSEPRNIGLNTSRTGYVGVDGGRPGDEAILFDVAGRVMGRVRGGGAGTRWIGPLDNGVYFCRLRTAAGVQHRKVVVVR